MIEGARQRHRRPRHDCAVDDDRPRLQRPHAEDRRLGIVDDRHALVEPERTEIGHGERGALQLSGFQRARPRLVDQPSRPSPPTRVSILSCASLTTGTSSPRGAATPMPRCTAGWTWMCGPSDGVHPRRVEHRMMGQRDRQQPQRQDERRDRLPVVADSRAAGHAASAASSSRPATLACASGISLRDNVIRCAISSLHARDRRRRRRSAPAARSGEHVVAGDDAVRARNPVPATARSTCRSAASLRTGGLARGRVPSGSRAPAGVHVIVGAVADENRLTSGFPSSWRRERAHPSRCAPAPRRRRAFRPPPPPSSTMRPAYGLGISTSALLVSTVHSVWLSATSSPTATLPAR